MNQSKLFILVLLLLLFIVSCSKILLIPVTLIISGFFVVKKKYNIALIVLSVLFFISLIFDNKIETFNTEQSKEMVAVVPTENTPRVESTQANQPKSTQANQPKLTQANSEDNKQIGKPSTEKRHYHRLSIKEFSKLFFVLNSLLDQKYLEKYKMSIEEIIDNYRIKSIYDLSRTVLNREQNPRFNNFLEKITCRGKNGSVNYIECDNENYKKVYAFCELLYVYTLDLDKIIELINVNKIMSVCELSAKRSVLISNTSQTSYGFETIGLEYYLNEKSFSRKYYDILELLELDQILNKDKNESGFTLEEKLYNYHNSNKEAVKDLNSIMVLFDYYNIFDSYILNMEDDDFNWDLGILKSVDLNLKCWDLVYFFKEHDVKERIIKSINKITSVDDEFLNRGENPENPFDTTKEKNKNKSYKGSMINQLNQSNTNANTNLISDVYVEDDDIFTDTLNTHQKRFKTISDRNKRENEKIQNLLDKKINLKFIRENFNQKMVDITNDLIQLYSKRCDLDCYDSKNPMISRFLYYSKEILKILTNDERLIFVGILFIGLSIIFYFLGASR